MKNCDRIFEFPNLSLRHYYKLDGNELCQRMKPIEVESWQLSLGQFEGTVSQIIGDGVQIDLHQYNSLMRYKGFSLRTWQFGLPVKRQLIIFEHKYELEDNYILICPPQVGFMGVEKHFHGTYIFAFSLERLQDLCETLHLPEPEKFLGSANSFPRVVACSPTQMSQLRQSFEQLYQIFWTLNCKCHLEKDTLLINYLKEKLEEEIAENLLLTVATSQNIKLKKVIIRRSCVLKQVEDFMMNNLTAEISCNDICQAVGVSKRTLEYIFKEFYNITPKAYFKRLRLNYLRQCLQENYPQSNISEIAENLGFFHRGDLAADYQKLFGELPSDTVK